MNQKLLDLAQQAGLRKAESSDVEYLGYFSWPDFAELIVEHCGAQCRSTREHLTHTYSAEYIRGFETALALAEHKIYGLIYDNTTRIR